MVTVMVYGATGRTGRLVAGELARAGVPVVLAGRDEARLKRVAGDVPGDYRVADIESLAGVLDPQIEVVVNVAGPFASTVGPVATAAARAGAHYVDLSNEWEAVASLVELSPLFERAGRSAIPAAGFGTIATDALAQRLVNGMPTVTRLELGMHIDGDGRSPAAARSAALALAAGGARLDKGHLIRTRLGAGAIRHPDSPRASLVPLGLADLVVTPITTGVDNVTVGVLVPMPPLAVRAVFPLLVRLGGRRPPRGHEPTGTGQHTSRAWARAWRPDGTVEWADLTAGEGYEFSARAAAATIRGLLDGGAHPGVVTAVGQFGPALAEQAGGRIRTSHGAVHASAE
jgi:short subunit dehydrogenase-like uncharacterized protein